MASLLRASLCPGQISASDRSPSSHLTSYRVHTAFMPSLPSSFPSSSSCSSCGPFTFSRRKQQVAIQAITPGFYKIPVYPGVPVGSTMKLYNLPYDVDREAVIEHFKANGATVESLEITNCPEENNAHGIIKLGDLDQCCWAKVRLDGAQFQGKCLRMDFVNKRPYDPEPPKRSRMNRAYQNNYNYNYGTSTGTGSYGSNASGTGSYGANVTGTGSYGSNASGTVSYGANATGTGSYGDATSTSSYGNATATGSYGDNANSTNNSGYGGDTSSYSGDAGNYTRSSVTANRIYVGNLPWRVDESSLQQLFTSHGVVFDARVVKEVDTGRSRGFGFVTMSTPEEMQKAISALDGYEMDGRRLRVNPAN